LISYLTRHLTIMLLAAKFSPSLSTTRSKWATVVLLLLLQGEEDEDEDVGERA